MEGLLGSKSFPPGFRFHPTDEELLVFYLKRKVLGKPLGPQMLAEVDVYRFAPWDLPVMACLKTRDLNWYFFCPRAKKYPNGGRANRATKWGYWKSTGNDRTVMYASRPVGKIKTLIFHRGKAPKGERTDWVMHEYRLEDKVLTDKGVSQDSYVICKIYEKSGLGPRNGEDYGARFVEEEWDSDSEEVNVPVNGQERDSGVVLHDKGCGRVGDSPDGSVSVLTAASPVDTPIVAAATNVGSPCTTSAFVGAPFSIADNVGTPFITATSVDMPDVTPAPEGMPIVTPASVGSAAFVDSAADVTAMAEDEWDRLLDQFFVEDVGHIHKDLGDLDVGDFYNVLGDLADRSTEIIDWYNCFEMNDILD